MDNQVSDGYSCFRKQCSPRERQVLQSVWNTNCNITATPLPIRDGIILTAVAKIGIAIASGAIFLMIVVPSLILLRRQQRLNQNQHTSIWYYIVLLCSSPWFNWIASHISFTCTALALVLVSSLGSDDDNQRLYQDQNGGDDLCQLESLSSIPMIIVSQPKPS